MTDPNFERSLRAAARRGRTGGVHPDASLLAAYVDRGLSDTERSELETHVADCAECMEQLALLGSVNVPEEPQAWSLDWSLRQLMPRWGWLVPVATVVVLVAIWERQPSAPASFTPASPVAPAANQAASAPNETLPYTREAEERRSADASAKPSQQFAQAPKAKDASARPQLQAAAPEGTRRQKTPQPDVAADNLAMGDKKELDAVSPLQANKIVAAPAVPPAAAPATAGRAHAEAAASVAGRADEAKAGNQPQGGGAAPMRESVAQGALLKSAIEPSAVLASGPGVSIRRIGSRLERSTDNGATWAVDLPDAPAGLRAGSCPTTTVCWLGGLEGTVLVRQPSGTWTRHVVADGRAAVTAIQAADGLGATVTLSDGRRFQTSDGGASWVAVPVGSRQ
jgi:hypothetical protein